MGVDAIHQALQVAQQLLQRPVLVRLAALGMAVAAAAHVRDLRQPVGQPHAQAGEPSETPGNLEADTAHLYILGTLRRSITLRIGMGGGGNVFWESSADHSSEAESACTDRGT